MANALTKTNTTLSPNSISNKQASVEEMSTMKQVLLGNEQTQRAIVTADQQGNELAQNRQVQDALYMDPFEFAVKYGPTANRERQRIRDAYSSLKADQRLARSSGEAIGDSALSALNGLVQLGGFVPTLGAMGYDSIGKGAEYVADAILPEQLEYNYEPIAPAVSGYFDNIGKSIGELKSDSFKTKAEQFGLQQSLDAQDREAAYERGDTNWFQKQAAGVTDTLSNMANVPEMITDTAANAAGSLIPFAAAAQATARAVVLARLSKEGVTGVQAQAYLRTAAGQRAVQEASIQAVPALGATVGAGSAANQAQVAILSMSDETLQTMPDYAELRAQGLDNDAIRNRLASQAGNVAALPGAVIGYVAGFLNRGFDAAPLRTGGTTALSRATQGVTNIPREAAQEFIEEGGANQLSANIGVASVDPSQQLDEGVAEAGTMGAVGGGITAATTQAPALAIETLAATGKTVLSGITSVADARANRADDRSTTGINATQSAVNTIIESVDTIAQSDVSDTAKQEIVQEIVQAITINDGEAAIADWITSLDDAKITDVTPSQATQVISALAAVQNIASDTLKEKVNALDEADPVRQAYNTAVEQMNTVESSTILEKSKEVISKLSADEVKQLVPLDQLNDENTSQEQKKAITQTAAVVSRINPQAFTAEEYDIVLNQMSPEDAGKISQNDRTSIETARANAQISAQTDTQKANNKSRFQKVLDKLPAAKKKAEQVLNNRIKSVQDVRIDIRERGNTSSKDGKASLAQYVANVNQLMSEGKINAAQDLLTNLGNFAQSQINKIGSLNQASQDGATGKAYGFDAWTGSDFKESKLKVFVNKNSPNSLLFALDAFADTQEIIDTYEALRNAYPELGSLKQKTAPALDLKIDELLDNFPTQRDQRIEETPPAPAEKPAKQETKEKAAEPQAEETSTT